MSINFNDVSEKKFQTPEETLEKAHITGERPRFIHKPNPLVERAYQIFEYDFKNSKYDHVGDYVLLDKDEPRSLTEKKVINVITRLNGKKDLIDLSNLTKTRLLYTIVPEAQAGDQTKIIFKDYDGAGVSKDNAVFTIRKGVLYDRNNR